MNDKILRLSDVTNTSDSLSFNKSPNMFRTEVIGYDDSYKDENGIMHFGKQIFKKSNKIVLGGGIFTLEKLFNTTSDLTVNKLEDIMSITRPGEPALTQAELADTHVCLFGIGTGGWGESITDEMPIYYYEREIVDMIPFRQVEAGGLTLTEEPMYWFKKEVSVGLDTKNAYYLKRFETDPEIKVLWKDAEGDEDGTAVTSNVYQTLPTNTTPIETFIEMTLKVNKKDAREFFQDNGTIEQARVNSIGLFFGTLHTVNTVSGEQDYRNVKLFSKLNIHNEMLVLSKNLTIVYRIFTS